MTEEKASTVTSDEASQTRQRKKRKWDQPAESLVSAGFAVPGILPLGAVGSLGGGVTIPGATPVSSALLVNPLVASCSNVSQVIPPPLIQQHIAAMVPKIVQPKIQDELIAREIVINDAESTVRYKLTKRQTQEEIQRCTGAVVITRGKYRLPNAPSDGEKPLYLHISAGAHLKDTAERILAVDRAAAMVEEMLKPDQNVQAVSSTLHPLSNGTKGTHALSMSIFLGFDADPSLNIAARIRGPNDCFCVGGGLVLYIQDQYINHIMNETGATVILRGRGSGSTESLLVEEPQLHLFLSSHSSKSLEDARRLSENLLDTISVECGVSRVSSSKVYSAVPPPQQVYRAVPPPQKLLAGVQNSMSNLEASTSSTAGLTTSTMAVSPVPPVSSVRTIGISSVFPQGKASQSGGLLNCDQSQVDSVSHSPPLFSGGTSYSGYGGIYPQATPLQQVALALRQSTSPVSSTATPTTSEPSEPMLHISNSDKEKRLPQKRKFQELPIGSKGSAKPIQYSLFQGSEFSKSAQVSADVDVRNVSTMPAPKILASMTASCGMPPPPSRTMAPPPPPPKFASSSSVKAPEKTNILNKTKSDSVPDTLVKLLEYGDDDDDDDDDGSEENSRESSGGNSGSVAARKPFWAL
ncbi:protein RIK isoform X2 [Humulus lupulus]|uniref:protein RIK isoform X2 n=1 Tax=Humulus lupulus TaxID=3486 RepID=UPI002B4149CF|nr:protein RIK isoform X2 [Humulus lupulus]